MAVHGDGQHGDAELDVATRLLAPMPMAPGDGQHDDAELDLAAALLGRRCSSLGMRLVADARPALFCTLPPSSEDAPAEERGSFQSLFLPQSAVAPENAL